jgi:hypothetical protein
MVAAGFAAAALMSGTGKGLDLSGAWHLVPRDLDGRSLAWGGAAGFLLAHVLRISWHDLPQRTLAWAFSNRRGFRLLGYGGAFLAVLLLY